MGVITLIYFLIVFQFIYPFCIRYFGFPNIKSLYINLMLAGLFIFSWLKYPSRSNSKSNPFMVVSKYKFMFFLLFYMFMFSSIINDRHWFLITKYAIEYYFPYLLLFLIITRIKLTNNEEIKLIKLCYFLIIIQIPVVLMQYFFGGYTNPDSMSGTIGSGLLGGTGINGVLSVFLFSMCMSRIILTKFDITYLMLGLLAFVPSIFGGSKFGVILMGVAVVVLLFSLGWIRGGQGLKGIVKYCVVVFLLIIFIYGVFVLVIPEQRFEEFVNFDLLTNPKDILAYDTDPGSRRILGYVILVNIVFKNWINLFFGLGPGATEGSMEFGLKANRAYEAYFPLGAPDTIGFMATIGIIGLILMIMILFYGIVWVKKYLQIETNPFMKMTGYAFIPITVACLISLTYTLVWSTQIGLTYWVLAGVLVKRFGELVESK